MVTYSKVAKIST